MSAPVMVTERLRKVSEIVQVNLMAKRKLTVKLMKSTSSARVQEAAQCCRRCSKVQVGGWCHSMVGTRTVQFNQQKAGIAGAHASECPYVLNHWAGLVSSI